MEDMKSTKKLGIWGLDTSHSIAFTKLCHDASSPHYIEGLQVVKALKGGSPGFGPSDSRIDQFVKEMEGDLKVPVVESVEDFLTGCDAFLLESVDGRNHLREFEQLCSAGKPIFIDKPLAGSSEDARKIIDLAEAHKIPIFSASALRYCESIERLNNRSKVCSADLCGPLRDVGGIPLYFWYGVHLVEMLVGIFGSGCSKVIASGNASNDLLTLEWNDGRIATLRGHRWEDSFGFRGCVYYTKETVCIDTANDSVPFYAKLMRVVSDFVRTGNSPLSPASLFETVAIMDAATRSQRSGKWELVETL